MHVRPDGFYQWQSMRGTPLGWSDTGAYDGLGLRSFRFGDFDADGLSDVFTTRSAPNSLPDQWLFSSGGASSYASLGYDRVSLLYLRPGRFDADLKTDIFASIETAPESGVFDYK